MPQTGGVLTRGERWLSVAVVGVLTSGVAASTMTTAPVPAKVVVAPAAVRSAVPLITRPPQRRPVAKPRKPKPPPVPRPVPPAPPVSGCPVPKRPPTGHGPAPLGPPLVADAALPAAVPVTSKATSLTVVRGKGLWVTPWPTTSVDVGAWVAQARRTGVRSLWVRTGGSRQGYYGDRFLGSLVPAAHRAGIAVIAWDFPFLSDPVGDSRRAQRALAAGVDAFSPDVETAAEGTYVSTRRLSVYLSLVRRYAGGRPVIATVPRPTSAKSRFPYPAFAPYADAFAPMVYWSCREPGLLVQQSIARLRRLLPVAPVGQGYDMGPEGGRVGVPSALETLRFLDAARRGGALGASLWTVETAGPSQLQALGAYPWPVPR